MYDNSNINEKAQFDLPPFLTAEEVATLLRVKPRTVYELVRDGTIPKVESLGRMVRIPSQAIRELANVGVCR